MDLKTRFGLGLLVCLLMTMRLVAQPAPWMPDLGDGTYKNPVIYADYSDPDAIRVGTDYYLIASSFCNVPGLPVLHSKDLVNWTLISYALPKLIPEDYFSVPRAGEGVWAPALRYHDGKYMIYYPDPDFGLYVVTATDPAGKWSKPILLRAGKGLIDPCPFWDEDGQAYLIHGWAKSRAGINNLLTLCRLSPDGTKILDEGKIVIDANKIPEWRTLEGPKLYKRNGYYYVFAPAGGVKPGWQAVFRAKDIYGPYEHRIVLSQGKTDINGPHQGAWVDTPSGQDWFLHFQDRDAYGRLVHLQPMVWRDDWPVMGNDPDGDGNGEPFRTHAKPEVGGTFPVAVPPTSDEFDADRLGLAWQWQANSRDEWYSLTAASGSLRLFGVAGTNNLWEAPSLLAQKFPAPAFSVTTRMEFSPKAVGERAGIVVVGFDYAWIGLEKTADGLRLVQRVRKNAREKGVEKEFGGIEAPAGVVYLRMTVQPEAKCRFSYSFDGDKFTPLGQEFTAEVGRWIGAKFGLFVLAAPVAVDSAPAASPHWRTNPDAGHADFAWFRVTPPVP